jgi:hypothetical protein
VSIVTITANESIINNQTSIAQGNSYQVKVFASCLTSPNNATLIDSGFWFNVINAGAL